MDEPLGSWEDEFGQLRSSAYAVALRKTANHHDAEDIAQEVADELRRNWERYRGLSRAHRLAICRKMAGWRAKDVAKKRDQEPPPGEVGPPERPDPSAPRWKHESYRRQFARTQGMKHYTAVREAGGVDSDDDIAVEAVREALGGLPGRQQVLLRLRYGNEYSEAQIANILDESQAAIKKALTVARSKLRDRTLTMLDRYWRE